MGITESVEKDDVIKQLRDETIYAQKQLRDAQTRYKRHFDARLRRTTDNVSVVV